MFWMYNTAVCVCGLYNEFFPSTWKSAKALKKTKTTMQWHIFIHTDFSYLGEKSVVKGGFKEENITIKL